MTEDRAPYSPGSQASYERGGGQLAKNGVVQETEECPHGATRMTGQGLKCALCGEVLEQPYTLTQLNADLDAISEALAAIQRQMAEALAIWEKIAERARAL